MEKNSLVVEIKQQLPFVHFLLVRFRYQQTTYCLRSHLIHCLHGEFMASNKVLRFLHHHSYLLQLIET